MPTYPDTSISGLPTSITAFVGYAARGPVETAQRIFNHEDFERRFAGPDGPTDLGIAVQHYFANGGQEALVVRLSRTAAGADDFGKSSGNSGIYALEASPVPFNLLCLPDLWRLDGAIVADVVKKAADLCGRHRAFLLVDPPRDVTTADEARQWVVSLGERASSNAAFYFPNLTAADPKRPGAVRAVPPSGAMAGVYAATDARRGVWKAPAGIDCPVRTAQGVSLTVTDQQNGALTSCGVNVMRTFPVHGVVPWGARTLDGADEHASHWKYIPVRRLALHIENSLRRGLQWVAHEANDEVLWAQIRLSAGTFMHDLFHQGAFAGTTPSLAYMVKCDGETTQEKDRIAGICILRVGFAPLRPGEFIELTLRQKTGTAGP